MRRLVIRLLFLLTFFVIPAATAFFLARVAAPPKLGFKAVEFSGLEGWGSDGQKTAFSAFLKRCPALAGRPGFGTPEPYQGKAFARAFNDACLKGEEGRDYYSRSDEDARAFFENTFRPYRMTVGWSKTGTITGYYEARIEVSETPGGPFQYPLYAAPSDQVTIDLKRFRDTLSGTWIGRLEGKRVVPYYTRSEIENGALTGQGLEILWARDPVAVYFLQVQGSGRAVLPNGTVIGVGYAAKNGHPNTLAGRTLVEKGLLERDQVSMRSIREWFSAHPERVNEILHADDSYVFFRVTGGEGPFGSAGAELTAERSLAVDVRFIPLGVPIWVEGDAPAAANPGEETRPFRHLMIAQDTGGAIKGEIRGDVFWGFGPEAEAVAGHMNNQAAFVILLPNGFGFGD